MTSPRIHAAPSPLFHRPPSPMLAPQGGSIQISIPRSPSPMSLTSLTSPPFLCPLPQPTLVPVLVPTSHAVLHIPLQCPPASPRLAFPDSPRQLPPCSHLPLPQQRPHASHTTLMRSHSPSPPPVAWDGCDEVFVSTGWDTLSTPSPSSDPPYHQQTGQPNTRPTSSSLSQPLPRNPFASNPISGHGFDQWTPSAPQASPRTDRPVSTSLSLRNEQVLSTSLRQRMAPPAPTLALASASHLPSPHRPLPSHWQYPAPASPPRLPPPSSFGFAPSSPNPSLPPPTPSPSKRHITVDEVLGGGHGWNGLPSEGAWDVPLPGAPAPLPASSGAHNIVYPSTPQRLSGFAASVNSPESWGIPPTIPTPAGKEPSASFVTVDRGGLATLHGGGFARAESEGAGQSPKVLCKGDASQ